MVDVTVATPSIPGRERLLREAMASVQAQTVKPRAHLVRVQEPPEGVPRTVHVAQQRNRLLCAVDSEWCATLDDDDLLVPHHFETIAKALNSDADLVYTLAPQPWVPDDDVTDWPQARLIERLERRHDCVPSNAAVRTSTLRAIGGWDETTFTDGQYASGADTEDWDLRLRLAREGARFVCVPAVTWEYRQSSRR